MGVCGVIFQKGKAPDKVVWSQDCWRQDWGGCVAAAAKSLTEEKPAGVQRDSNLGFI